MSCSRSKYKRDERITLPCCLLMSVCGSVWAQVTNGQNHGAQLNASGTRCDPDEPENRVNRNSALYRPDIIDIGAISLGEPNGCAICTR